MKHSVIAQPSSATLEPFVLTVPSTKNDLLNSTACAARPTDSLPATVPTVASSPVSAANVPFDVSSLKQSTSPKRSPVPVAPQSDFIKQILPSLPITPGQTSTLPIGANNSFNFHQQLVVLHAQAIVLTDAVMKTRQFVEQQKWQKKSKSKIVQNQIQKQFDQLVQHQQNHERQFLMMLQKQEDTMRQNQPHISTQQHQQQQAQFMNYKQLMDNLVSLSKEVGMHPTTQIANAPVGATANAGDRLSQLQYLIGQRHFDPTQRTTAIGHHFQSPLFDQNTVSPGWGPVSDFQINAESESLARNMQKFGGAASSQDKFAAVALEVGAPNSHNSCATKPHVHSDAKEGISLESHNKAQTNHEESRQSAANFALSKQHLTRPLSFQEFIQLNIESQQRELEAQIQFQEQQKSECQNQQGQFQAAQEANQQKADQSSESSQLRDLDLAQSRFKSHVASPILLQNSRPRADGATNIWKVPNSGDSKKSMNGNAKQRMLSNL
jgi:hypothetical protein